jgi:RimJ/RimL family protein N-acetyltransferase
MTDAALAEDRPQLATTRTEETLLRASQHADLGLVHARLAEAIDGSPFYSDEFKAYERGRLNRDWLEALHEADPWHVAIMQLRGEAVGFMLSGPELGTLWLYWSYLFPEKRRSAMALTAMRTFLAHWQRSRFHKVATYARPENTAAIAIMVRFGWTRTALLEQHIFGDDYLLYEHRLEKVEPGYDHGLALGRMAAFRRAAHRLVGR